jgi:hypothetical protein
MTRVRARTVCLVVFLLISAAGATAIAVSAAHPNIQISSVTTTPEEPTTGESITVETTIKNLESSTSPGEITAIYVRASTGGLNEHGRIRNIGMIGPGGEVTVPMSVSFDEPGKKRLTVHVGVEGVNETHQTYEYPLALDVADPTVRAGLSTNASNDGSNATDVTLTNFGNTDLTDIEITATANGTTIDRNFLLNIAPGSSRTTTFPLEDPPAETVVFNATYTTAGRSHATTRAIDLSEPDPIEGEIRLTGTETRQVGSDLTIEGEAANIGSTNAESVLVRLPDNDSVRPVSPSGEYFVGAVDASEFATFELTGKIEDGVSSVPVEITYIVDGKRMTTTQQLGVASSDTIQSGASQPDSSGPQSESGGQSGGLPLIAVAIAGLLVVASIGIYRWRKQ